MLKGYKTYIVSALLVATAALGWLNGDSTVQEAFSQVLFGLGWATLRHGMPK